MYVHLQASHAKQWRSSPTDQVECASGSAPAEMSTVSTDLTSSLSASDAALPPIVPLSRPRVSSETGDANAEWVQGLTAVGLLHDKTMARLYILLLKIGYTEARRRNGRLQLSGPELDDIVHQAAGDSAIAICKKIDTFRGDCRFTTWAYRFVALNVTSKISRHFWQRGTATLDESGTWPSDPAEAPEVQAESRDLADAVQRVFENDLTERQQRAFEAIAMRGLPVSEVATDLGSTPNAIYKTMFDARRKLRSGLTRDGYLTES